jgi:CheY-like chemotaxis protein
MTSLTTNPILIVDDEQTIRLGFSIALRSAGFEVEMAANGEEAVELATKLSPDCIVIDLRMPGMDGLEAAGELRARGLTMPIVLASAFVDHQTAVAAIGAGITDFLIKPVKPTQLRYAVNHALSRHVRFAQAANTTTYAEIPNGLLRAYAKYCLSQKRRDEAKMALQSLTSETTDLQSLLLLGALCELDGHTDRAGEYFVRAAEVHTRTIPLATPTEHADRRGRAGCPGQTFCSASESSALASMADRNPSISAWAGRRSSYSASINCSVNRVRIGSFTSSVSVSPSLMSRSSLTVRL